jgi:hypothetical protein
MGDLEGLFIADPKIVSEALGKEMSFGEALGKHSEIYDTFDEDQIEILSEDQDKIQWLISVVGATNSCSSISGYNPLDYLAEEEDDEEDDEDMPDERDE